MSLHKKSKNEPTPVKVVITTDGYETSAQMYHFNERLGGYVKAQIGRARCHPADKFDFEIGSRIALDRLFFHFPSACVSTKKLEPSGYELVGNYCRYTGGDGFRHIGFVSDYDPDRDTYDVYEEDNDAYTVSYARNKLDFDPDLNKLLDRTFCCYTNSRIGCHGHFTQGNLYRVQNGVLRDDSDQEIINAFGKPFRFTYEVDALYNDCLVAINDTQTQNEIEL